MFERPKIIKSHAIFAPVSQKVYTIMNRDAIDFERDGVFSLFRKLLIPTLLGSVAMSAMSTIDGIFVGHGVGAAGVAAVNIAVPVYQVMTGIGFMIGAGSSVVASIHLSRKNLKVARINVTQSLVFASLLVFLFVAAVMLFPVQSARILGSSESLMPMVLDYLKWVMPSFLFEIWVLIGLFVIRLDGSPRYAMWCNIVPAIVNVVLDWLLIIRLRMGVEGAAIASAAGIVVGGLMAAVYLLFFARTLRLIPLKISPMSMRLALRNIAYQCRIGSSSLLGELTLAVFIYVGNWQFMRYLGDDGVGAFGIACYYAPLFFMIGNAIAQSAQPIISYNYGIGRTTQVVQARNLLLRSAAAFGIFVSLLFIFFPAPLVGLFVDVQENAGLIATHGFPLFGCGVVFFIVNVALTGYYQSIERVRKSTLFVLLRGFLLLIPCFFILPLFFGTDGMWLAMPVTEVLTLLCIYASWRLGRRRACRRNK